MKASRTTRAGFVVAAGVALAALGPWACRENRGSSEAGSATSAEVVRPLVPAGKDVTAMLGGLRPGDRVQDFEVTWVGAVRRDGAVTLRLERGGRRMRLAVALHADDPRPAVSTEKYALYYEDTKRSDAASEADCVRVLEALASRIRKVEASVATPKGMRPMAPASSPM